MLLFAINGYVRSGIFTSCSQHSANCKMTAQTWRNMMCLLKSTIYSSVRHQLDFKAPAHFSCSLLNSTRGMFPLCTIGPKNLTGPIDPRYSTHRMHWCISHIYDLLIVRAVFVPDNAPPSLLLQEEGTSKATYSCIICLQMLAL